MKKIVVIGAGPAGAVASGYLVKQGFEVIVLEKEGFPRFVIGESLLPKCMESLEEAGLMPPLLEKGYQKKMGASYYNRENQSCTFLFSQQFSKSWDWTWNVQRMNFDQDLVDAAKTNGVQFLFGSTVTSVEIDGDYRSVTYEQSGEKKTVEASFIIDASGYGRVLPKLFDLEKSSAQKPRGAVFAHFVDQKRTGREGDDIFIYPFDDKNSWIWVIPFSDGTASVGLVSETEETKAFAADNYEEYLNFVRSFELLKGRFTEAEYKRDPTMILGYSVGVKQMYGEGYVLCGNSTEFLDPVFSSGVTLATVSGLLAAKLVEKELNGESVDWKTAYEDEMQYGIEVFRSYVNGWYNGELQTIFFNPKINAEIKKKICSVLAGHVWDLTNPFVKKHRTILSTLANVINIENKAVNVAEE
ncbi:flavin-dependent dehydrogenase [Algoriphagus sp. 4150]|uniref:NAD(P)/FAD-dependent oxidoreductase n=1 Tax=Algoriphagus sp. 4150 TaxID=2817756 RepID=UPI00285FF328|nr:NAD(P)/FAD-dependent oxidoreductase [Algoriphagus sp. 4150]MDR7129150.1 flavin-dependent dehydrogenase [Algoriphagus sp. 4150]